MQTYASVTIDGVRYVPAESNGPDAQAIRLLNEVYGRLWTEAYYDPFNDATRGFATPLAEKMSELNKLLGFKK